MDIRDLIQLREDVDGKLARYAGSLLEAGQEDAARIIEGARTPLKQAIADALFAIDGQPLIKAKVGPAIPYRVKGGVTKL